MSAALLTRLVLVALLGLSGAPDGRAAPGPTSALENAAQPRLGDIEQFPIVPRETPADQPAAMPARPAPGQAQPGNPLWAIPLRALSATRERPIFSPSRRPPPSAIVVAPPEPTRLPPPPPAAPERPSLALVGTIVGEGEKIAIFYNATTRATIRLRLGDTDDTGWKLVAVDARATLLEKGRQSVTLALPAPDETPIAVPGARRAVEPDL